MRRKIFLIAGEPSGDLLGARLMAVLTARSPDVTFCGVGGPEMTRQGLTSLFPMSDLTVMGITEVLPHLPVLIRRITQTAQAIRREKPDIVLTVDAPDFSFRVIRKIRDLALPKVHYGAPSVWAWRPWRARKVARLYDHLFCLLPFEPPYFEKAGLSASFVGHSAVEEIKAGNRDGFRRRHGVAAGARVMSVLPGSRSGEVSRLLPVFEHVVTGLKARYPDLHLFVPTVDKVAGPVSEMTAGWAHPVTILRGAEEKADAFAASDLALAASGTVSLELAFHRTPHIVAYKVSALSYQIARRLMQIDSVNLVNLVCGEKIVPEFLQHECAPEPVLKALSRILDEGRIRDRQFKAFQETRRKLTPGSERPSDCAARLILDLLKPASSSVS